MLNNERSNAIQLLKIRDRNLYLAVMKNILFIIATSFLLSNCGSSPSAAEQSSPEEDTLNYEMIYMVQSLDNCDKDSSGCTYIEFSFPQFRYVQKPLADSLELIINNAFKNNEQQITGPDSVQQYFLKEYANFKAEQKGYNIPWFIEKDLSVVNQNPKWITLQYTENSFTGGAHPNGYVWYKMLDKANGHQLLLTDFFDSPAIQKLTALGETLFKLEKGIAPNQTFDDAGYWFANNRFLLNHNFFIHDEGITFYYNNYEVGPYVVGSTTITIPAKNIVPLLKK